MSHGIRRHGVDLLNVCLSTLIDRDEVVKAVKGFVKRVEVCCSVVRRTSMLGSFVDRQVKSVLGRLCRALQVVTTSRCKGTKLVDPTKETGRDAREEKEKARRETNDQTM